MSGLSDRALQVALIAAALAALAILTSLFGYAVQWAALGVIVLATALTAPERHEPGGGWWALLAAGAAASALGAGVSELSETVGGLIAVIGGVLVVAAAAIGFPLADS